MKKIGEYTARGIVLETETVAGVPQKIPLFDGQFTTAYRVTRFQVWGSNVSGNGGYAFGKLSKNDTGATAEADFFRADDDNQIAWSQAGHSTSGYSISGMGDFIIDRDNMIVEDLYVYVHSNVSGLEINYLIEMDKYEISDWQGALTMARDKAQE